MLKDDFHLPMQVSILLSYLMIFLSLKKPEKVGTLRKISNCFTITSDNSCIFALTGSKF